MRSNRKRTLLLSVAVAILFISGAVLALAMGDAIPSICIDAALRSDGSVVITEVWDIHGACSDTEYYKVLSHVDSMSVHPLTVEDKFSTQCETLNAWDADHSREEKADICGTLKTSDGYEFCWGIGTYGDRQYAIQYVLDGLIKDYGDHARFYHQFVSDFFSVSESVLVKIRVANAPLTENNARIWGHGFPGKMQIASSEILTVDSSEPLGGGGYVNLLCRFERELFPQTTKVDVSFEDPQKNAGNEGSPIALYILGAIFAVLIIGDATAFALFFSRYELADGTTVRLAAGDQIRPTWSVLFNDSTPAVYAAMKLLYKGIFYGELMDAYLVR